MYFKENACSFSFYHVGVLIHSFSQDFFIQGIHIPSGPHFPEQIMVRAIMMDIFPAQILSVEIQTEVFALEGIKDSLQGRT